MSFIQGNLERFQTQSNYFSLNHSRNPVLNKSFDVLPQIKDDDTPYADPISENNVSIRSRQ